MDSERRSSFSILMFPWLAHGHIFPYLELAKRILQKKNFRIHFCSTAVNFSSIDRFIRKNSLEASIDLVELRLHPNPLLPPHYQTTKNLPPDLMSSLLEHFQTGRSSFSDIVADLKPDLVISDLLQPFALELASLSGIPAVCFSAYGAAATAYGYHRYVDRGSNFPFPELLVPDGDMKSVDDNMEFLKVNVYGQAEDYSFVSYRLSSGPALLKTSRGFEGKYMEYVSSAIRRRILSVGPLVDARGEEEDSDILRWLSEKEEHSTVYISFGSEHFLSEEEIGEIAKGVEISGVNFIWVIRFPVTEEEVSVEEALPEGFLERVGERGRVVSGWAPQASILRHPNTGAFVSHCGWSSLNESLYYGVPIIGMPPKLIMLVDARLMLDKGVSVEVVRDENGVYKGDEIAKAINEVIGEERGEGLRRRARELSEKMKAAEDGDIEETAECLWQLCCKNKGEF